MVSTILILALVVITLVLAWSLLSRKNQAPNARDCEEKRHEIDIQILRSFFDRNEFNYLHSSLSRKDFQNLLRKRIRLTLKMLRTVEEDMQVRVEVEHVAMVKGSSDFARQSNELLASTIQLRLNLMLARGCLWLQWLFPSSMLFLPKWITPYRSLLNSLEQRGFQQS